MRKMISKMAMIFILVLTAGCSPNRSAITPTLVPTPVTVEIGRAHV